MRLITGETSCIFFAGAVGAANAILVSNATSWGRLEAVLLMTELMRGNPGAKDEALAEGTIFFCGLSWVTSGMCQAVLSGLGICWS